MKETMLGKIYITVMGVATESSSALALTNWRLPTFAAQDAGDFGSVLGAVLQTRCKQKGELSVREVNELLDKMSANSDR